MNQAPSFNVSDPLNPSFGNDSQALAAVASGVALVNHSSWGLLALQGKDCLEYLHNQTTQDLQQRSPGSGSETCLVNATARLVALATVYVVDPAQVLLLVSPQQAQKVSQTLGRLLPFSQTKMQTLSPEWVTLRLIGPQGEALLQQVTPDLELPTTSHHHSQGMIAGHWVRVAFGSGLASPGYTLILAREGAKAIWSALTQGGAVPLGEAAWEQLRIREGRPLEGHELTEEYNPIEAGLWQTLSFTKGCYLGQEVITRLHTYKGLKRYLWQVSLAGPIAAGEVVWVGDKKAGMVTSVTADPSPLDPATPSVEVIALAYVRTSLAQAGDRVRVGDQQGVLAHRRYGAAPPWLAQSLVSQPD